ncbi:MAG: hypothetical protein ACRDHM_11235 [Actinomycetota bacterium]
MTTDRQIENLEAELDLMRPNLDASKREFLTHIERLLGDMFVDIAESAVTSNPAQAKALGQAKLGELKKRVASHVEKAPSIAKEYFNRPELWPHEHHVDWLSWSPDDWLSPTGGMRLPSDLANKMREAVRTLDTILSEYRLSRSPALPPVSENVKAAIASYNSALGRFAVLARDLAAVRKRQEREEVRDLWRNA